MANDLNWDTIRAWVHGKLGEEFDTRYTPAGGYCLTGHLSDELEDYHGVLVWRMLEHTFVSVPRNLWQEIDAAVKRQLASGRPISALTEPEFWLAALAERAQMIVGPAYQGFLDQEHFRPVVARISVPLHRDSL